MSYPNPIKLINWEVRCYSHPDYCHAPMPQHTWTTTVEQGFCVDHNHSKVCLVLSCGRRLCLKCIQRFDKILLDTLWKRSQRSIIYCSCNIPIHQNEIKMWLTAFPKEITETHIIQHFNEEKTCEKHKGNFMCAILPCNVVLCHQCIVELQQTAKRRHDREPVNQKQPYAANCLGCTDTIPGELLEMFLKEVPPQYHSYAIDRTCRIHQHHKIILRDVANKHLCKLCFVKNGHSTILLDGKRCNAADIAEIFEDPIQEELLCLETSGFRCDCDILKAQAKFPCGLYVCYHCLSQLEQKHQETNEAQCPRCKDVISTKQLRNFLEKYDESECYLIKTTKSGNCIDHHHWKIFCESNNSSYWRKSLCLMCIYEKKKFPALPIKAVQHFLKNNDLTMKHLYAATEREDTFYPCYAHRHKIICKLPCSWNCCFRCIEEILQSKETLHIEVEGVSFECYKCSKCADLIPVDDIKSAVDMCKETYSVEIKLKKYTNCTRCLRQSKKGTAVFPCGASLCEDCFLNDPYGSGTNTPINVLGQDCIRCSDYRCPDVIPISSLEEIFNISIKKAGVAQDQNGYLHTLPSHIGEQTAVGPLVDQEMADISVERTSGPRNVDADNEEGNNANALSEERDRKNNRRMTAGNSSNFSKKTDTPTEQKNASSTGTGYESVVSSVIKQLHGAAERTSGPRNVDTDNEVGTNANALSEERDRKNNRRMTAGNSSNFSKKTDTPTEQKRASSTGTEYESVVSSVIKQLHGAAGTAFSRADSDSDNESLTFENVPTKKKRHLRYLKEELSSPYCSNGKQHKEAVIEFRDCSHRMCETCINKELRKGYPKVRCGNKKGPTRCENQIPVKVVEQYMENRIANTQLEKVCFLKTTTTLKCSKMLCSKKAVVIFNECDHKLCIDCMIKLSSYHENPLLCGVGIKACKVKIPMQPLNEYIEDIKRKPWFYIKESTDGYYCSICQRKAAVIEFRYCGHRLCAECVRKMVTKQESKVCGVGWPSTCANEIPTAFIEEHLRRFYIRDVCDNPECTAEHENIFLKQQTRKLPCTHNLCVICVSMQKLREGDEAFCKVPYCNTAESNRRHLPRRPAEITGIPNIGLTCYASCVLQVLGQTPKFTSKLREYSEHKVAAYLYELLKHINDVERSRDFCVNWDSMNNLMQAIFQLDRSFKLYRENDCHSFIMSLFNALSKADEDRKEQKPRVVGNSFLDENSAAETSNPRKRTKDSMEGRVSTEREEQSSSKIQCTCPTSLFESRLTSQFKYSTCNHKEYVEDQLFYSLLLPATKDSPSIRHGLDVYFKSEEFLHNAVPCRECRSDNRNTTTTRTPLLARAPQILMIQLARFGEVSYFDVGYKEIEKTYHSVEFERTLIIKSSYTADKRELEYELYGVVIHRGSMHGGHYTSYVRNLKSKKWYYCSDSSVSETSEENVFLESVIKQAYLLFYRRKA